MHKKSMDDQKYTDETSNERTESRRVAIGIQEILPQILERFSEKYQAGGSYVSGENRLLLVALAFNHGAKDILELGANTGMTSCALALTGANIVAVDNKFEDKIAHEVALERFQNFPNITVEHEDALYYLTQCDNESFDMIFVDDCHWPEYTKHECRELQRVLRPGGLAVFHDTHSCLLWDVVNEYLPTSWQRINLPSWQVGELYTGVDEHKGQDFGLAIARKPHHRESLQLDPSNYPHPENIELFFQGVDEKTNESFIIRNEDTTTVISSYLNIIMADRNKMIYINDIFREDMKKNFRKFGMYCAARASEWMMERFLYKKKAKTEI